MSRNKRLPKPRFGEEEDLKNKTRMLYGLLEATALVICATIFLSAPCPTNYAGISNNAPAFIERVSPAPGAEVALGCYSRRNTQNFLRLLQESFCPFCTSDISNTSGWVESGGLNVKLSGQAISSFEVYKSSDKDFESLDHRIFLQIDGEPINQTWVWESPSALLANHNLSTEYIFIYHPFLLPGSHTAKITYRASNDKTLEYEWSFTIK